MLVGSEVKSPRSGKTTIGEAYAHAKDGELWLVNSYIPEYTQASRFNHEPKRTRKLLVHKREAAKLAAAIQREGMTLIPLKLYFNAKGRAKIELGVAKGKKLHDKRETEKQRDWQRDKARLLRDEGVRRVRQAERLGERNGPAAISSRMRAALRFKRAAGLLRRYLGLADARLFGCRRVQRRLGRVRGFFFQPQGLQTDGFGVRFGPFFLQIREYLPVAAFAGGRLVFGLEHRIQSVSICLPWATIAHRTPITTV